MSPCCRRFLCFSTVTQWKTDGIKMLSHYSKASGKAELAPLRMSNWQLQSQVTYFCWHEVMLWHFSGWRCDIVTDFVPRWISYVRVTRCWPIIWQNTSSCHSSIMKLYISWNIHAQKKKKPRWEMTNVVLTVLFHCPKSWHNSSKQKCV